MAAGKITYGNPIRYYVDGKEVTKSKFDEVFPGHPVKGDCRRRINTLMETSKAWPRLSDALGVGAGQKEKAEELYRKKGVPTEFVPDGCGGYSAVMRNNAHQRDVLKALGMKNNDGGYGSITG
jgi:hypothetical protein